MEAFVAVYLAGLLPAYRFARILVPASPPTRFQSAVFAVLWPTAVPPVVAVAFMIWFLFPVRSEPTEAP